MNERTIQTTTLPNGSVVEYCASKNSRHTDAAPRLLLHGIGSNADSWAAQLAGAIDNKPMLAWNAPGYGGSTPVTALRPNAQDYADKLWQWLDALQLETVHLVGHSLGCIMAARAAVLQPARVASLTLLSPAQGYAMATTADREAKRSERLHHLAHLGPLGMATKRSAAMLSPTATDAQKATVQALMASINPRGYTQAVHLLMDANLPNDLAQLVAHTHIQTRIACGSADTITPPSACAALAARFGFPYTEFSGVGHALAVQVGAALNDYLSGDTPCKDYDSCNDSLRRKDGVTTHV